MNFFNKFFCVTLVLLTYQAHGMLGAFRALYRPSTLLAYLHEQKLNFYPSLVSLCHAPQKAHINDQAVDFIAKSIGIETRSPGYRSYFHGIDDDLATLFALQKKLHEQKIKKFTT